MAERDTKIVKAVELRRESLQAIGSRYGITRERVRQIAKRAGCAPRGRHYPILRSEEKAKIASLYARGIPISHAAKAVGRSPTVGFRYLVDAGLHQPWSVRTPWSGREDAIVLREYPKAKAGAIRVRDIAKRLGRTKNEVIGRARRLGLHATGSEASA